MAHFVVNKNIPVDSNVVGFIVGAGGSTINMVKEQTGAHVQIRQPNPAENRPWPWVHIRGFQRQVDAADQWIRTIIAEGHSRSGTQPTTGPANIYNVEPQPVRFGYANGVTNFPATGGNYGQHPQQTQPMTGQYPHQTQPMTGQHPHQTHSMTGQHPQQTQPMTGQYPHQTQPMTGQYPHQTQQMTGQYAAVYAIPPTTSFQSATPPPPAGFQTTTPPTGYFPMHPMMSAPKNPRHPTGTDGNRPWGELSEAEIEKVRAEIEKEVREEHAAEMAALNIKIIPAMLRPGETIEDAEAQDAAYCPGGAFEVSDVIEKEQNSFDREIRATAGPQMVYDDFDAENA